MIANQLLREPAEGVSQIVYMKTDGRCPTRIVRSVSEDGQEVFDERESTGNKSKVVTPSAEERLFCHMIEDAATVFPVGTRVRIWGRVGLAIDCIL